MVVYVFGNPDVSYDNRVYEIANKLKMDFPSILYVEIKPNQELPASMFDGKHEPIILDTVAGIKKVETFYITDLDRFSSLTKNTTSVHDYDLGFQLKYLHKLGKLTQITIVGVPQTEKINYLRIQSIFKKLVAQDIHGS